MKRTLLSFAIISIIYCEKLSDPENQIRLETCGISPDDANRPVEQFPWHLNIVTYYSPGQNIPYHAFLVSQRHVIVLAYTLFDDRRAHWIHDTNFPINWADCKDNALPIPDTVIRRMYVRLSNCENVDNCGLEIHDQVVKGYFIGRCNKDDKRYGFGILELLNDTPNIPYFVPVCIPENDGTVAKDEIFQLQGQYPDTTLQYIDRVYYVQNATSHGCLPSAPDFVICSNGSIKLTETHFSIVRNESNINVMLGILSVINNDDKHNEFTSIGYYRKQICDLTGICSSSANKISKSSASNSKESNTKRSKAKIRRGKPEVTTSSLNQNIQHFTIFIITALVSMMIFN